MWKVARPGLSDKSTIQQRLGEIMQRPREEQREPGDSECKGPEAGMSLACFRGIMVVAA